MDKLYESSGYVKNAYTNSLKVLAAYENDKLLGIIRVVGDGYSIVFIQDIIVLPKYHRQGIGTALLKQILEIYQNVYPKTLLTENTDKIIQLYKSVGFDMDTDIECRAFTKMFYSVNSGSAKKHVMKPFVRKWGLK